MSGLLHHVLPTCRTVIELGRLIEVPLGIDSSGKSCVSSSSVEEQRERVQALLPWIHLCGRSLYFAGRQLLMALEDPAAARAAGLNAQVPPVIEQVRNFGIFLHICSHHLNEASVHACSKSTVQYSNCGRGSQTSALASEPWAHEGARRPITYPSLSGQVCERSQSPPSQPSIPVTDNPRGGGPLLSHIDKKARCHT